MPVFIDGRHVFTASAKAHQADCGNSEPTTYMAYARDVYEEGALIFPCVRIQRDYRTSRTSCGCARRGSAFPRCGTATTSPRSAPSGSASGGCSELADRYGLETLEQFVDEWLDYSERRMTEAIRELPSSKLRVSGRHDPLEGHPDGIPVNAAIEIDSEAGRIVVDLRDNDDCLPLGLNLSEALRARRAR